MEVQGRESEAAVLAVRGVTKRYGATTALRDVDLELHRGQVHAVAGENGSGKSTLVKILFGMVSPDAGRLEIDGQTVSFGSPSEAMLHGVMAITQEITLAPSLSVAENILMGRLPRRGGLIDWTAARREAETALASLGAEIDVRAPAGRLPLELQQEVEIARAISTRSRVLVLDEATSSLSEAATERLLRHVEMLRRGGAAILFISHRMREMYRAAQVATVLRDGQLVGSVQLPHTAEDELVRMMVGREGLALLDRQPAHTGEVLMDVAGLSTRDGLLSDVSFQLRKGEILGIAGLAGSGKSEVGLALGGMIPATGRVSVGDATVRLGSPRQAQRAGIGYVPEDRKNEALMLNRPVADNLRLGHARRHARGGVIRVGRERRDALRQGEKFDVRPRSLTIHVGRLSGGNQQKVVLARCFESAPRVAVLGEPTRGIDIGVKTQVYKFLHDQARRDTAIIVVSSELPELLANCDRILVMAHGRLAAIIDGADATEEAITKAAFGDTEPADPREAVA